MSNRPTSRTNDTIRTVESKESKTAMFKRIAISAGVISAVAIVSVGFVGNAPAARAEPLGEPVTKASAPVQVLRDYSLPGDPHDAVASFNQLVAEISGTAPASVIAGLIRNYPMPGDPHDAAFSLAELVGEFQRGEISFPALAGAPELSKDAGYKFLDVGAWDDTNLQWPNRFSVVPMPGDAHDTAAQLTEWYYSLQPVTPSRVRESD